MNLRHRLKQVFSGSFIRDVAKLSLGTLAGRVLTVAALPLLTRLYSPEDFALLASYVAIVSTIAVAACLRLEIAIPLAKTDDDAKHLLVLALLALAAVTLVALLVVLTWPQQLAAWTGQPALLGYGWLIPTGIAALGLFSVMQYWATRAACNCPDHFSSRWGGPSYYGVGGHCQVCWATANTSAGRPEAARWSIKTGANFQCPGHAGLEEHPAPVQALPNLFHPGIIF
jgi:hypothetical protein